MRKARLRRAVATTCSTALAAGALVALGAPAHASAPAGQTGRNSAGTAAVSGVAGRLSAEQASARAAATGRPVVADALTTAFQQTTANPDGTYTLTESAAPSRVYRDGAWTALDATLHTDSDGTVSPAATSSALTLSGGGDGPFATLVTGGQSVALTLPVPLPAPSLSGNTATYSQVIPGVDLVVTVTRTGAFSDVFEVHDAKAAADPRLASLLSAKLGLSSGLTQSPDKDGNLTVSRHGHPVLTAAAPYAWDSATSATAGARGTDLGAPAASSVDGPGRAAHVARLGMKSGNGRLTLSAPASVTSGTAAYPVYIDPTYSPSYGANAWASFGNSSSVAGTQEFNKSTDPTGDAFIGLGSNVGNVWSAFNFALPDTGTSSANNLVGAHISVATFGIVAITSGGYCSSDSTNNVDIYAPNPAGGNYVSSTHADYDYWSAHVGSVVTHANFDGAQTCGNSGAGAFIVTSAVSNEVGSYKTGNQTFVLAAEDTGDYLGTKRFVFSKGTAGNPTLTVTYDKAPTKPSNPTLSVGDGCGSTIGDTGVSLIAKTGDVMPFQLTNTFDLYLDGGSAGSNLLTGSTATGNGVASDSTVTTPGQLAVLPLPEKFLKALSPNNPVTLDWTVTSKDATPLSSAPSTVCKFTFDPSRPGAPTITPTADSGGTTCLVAGSTTGTAPAVGSTCTFTLAPPSGQSISGYTYELNQQNPVTVTTTGSYTLQVTVPQIINTLTVNALSAGGNIGQSAVADFYGTRLTTPAVDGSVTNDGEPDMIASGGTGVLPSGLWIAQSGSDGALSATADIGLNGLGYSDSSTDPATDWDDSSVITGDFCGIGTQDVMAYYTGGANAGGAAVACSTGADTQLTVGQPLSTSTGAQINPGTTFSDGAGNNATQLANFYNTSGRNTGEPDLFATIGDQPYLFTAFSPNTYTNDSTDFSVCDQDCDILTSLAPPTVGGSATTWSSWIVTTAQVGTSTDMYLWNPGAGVLDLWTDITADTTGGKSFPNFTGLTYTQYTGTAPWAAGQSGIELRAATLDPNASAPALWALDTATGKVTAYSPTLSGSGLSVTAGANSTISTFAHSWQFTDMPDGAAGDALGTSADAVPGGPALTGTATDAVWHTGDVYSPDAMLNTNADGQTPLSTRAGDLTASAAAVTVNSTFSVAAAVRPNAAGGTVLSQNGTHTAGFTLGSTAAGQWQFCMARSDVAAPALDCATGGTVDVGLWSTITGTYDSTAGILRLYVNGAQAAFATHTGVAGFTSAFQVGDAMTSGAAGSFYSGQVAEVTTWNASGSQVVAPTAGRIYDRGRSAAGAWDSSADRVETNGPVTAVASATLPDGTLHVETVVPGFGVYDSARAADGTWGSPTHIDLNGSVTAVAAAAMPDGTLHVETLLPGSGVFDRTRATDGTWNTTTKIDLNGSISAIAAAALPDGTLHVETLVPGSGVYDRTRATDGTWNTTTQIDLAGTITDIAAAALPDGTLHVETLVPGYGVYDRARATNGTWGSTTKFDLAGTITAISAAALPDGTLHVETLVPGYGVYDRARATNGTWGSTTKIDLNGSITDIAAAALPDGTMHVQTVV